MSDYPQRWRIALDITALIISISALVHASFQQNARDIWTMTALIFVNTGWLIGDLERRYGRKS